MARYERGSASSEMAGSNFVSYTSMYPLSGCLESRTRRKTTRATRTSTSSTSAGRYRHHWVDDAPSRRRPFGFGPDVIAGQLAAGFHGKLVCAGPHRCVACRKQAGLACVANVQVGRTLLPIFVGHRHGKQTHGVDRAHLPGAQLVPLIVDELDLERQARRPQEHVRGNEGSARREDFRDHRRRRKHAEVRFCRGRHQRTRRRLGYRFVGNRVRPRLLHLERDPPRPVSGLVRRQWFALAAGGDRNCKARRNCRRDGAALFILQRKLQRDL